jgi:hypothetical protein
MESSEFPDGRNDPFEFSAKTLAALEARRNLLVESGWSRTLTDELRNTPMIGLDRPTVGFQRGITRFLIRTASGNFYVLFWDASNALYTWGPVSEDYAREEAHKVQDVCGVELMKKFFAGTWNPPSAPRFYA